MLKYYRNEMKEHRLSCGCNYFYAGEKNGNTWYEVEDMTGFHLSL